MNIARADSGLRPPGWRWLLLLAFAALFAARHTVAEDAFAVAGAVRDAEGKPVADASVELVGGDLKVRTDSEGKWGMSLPAGEHTIRVRRAGYDDATRTVTVPVAAGGADVSLTALMKHSETVVVQAIRADADAPVTTTDMDRKQIDRANYGQEMPFVIQQAPSVTNYSESGLGAGYSYFYMRGIQQTRINMTYDGAPLNDPEESAVYFANFGDFASAVGSIQIQRGVGSSTIGAAAYGGSVNFTSLEMEQDSSFVGEVAGGSYGTWRGAFTAQSGQLAGGYSFYGRLLLQETDGFKEHSGVRQRAFYFAMSHQSEKSLFKLSGFTGLERTQLAFLATEESILERDLRFNELSPDETDRFGQDFLQAQYTRFLSPSSSLAFQGYYNGAQGWFRLWDDEVAQNELQQFGIHGYFVGGVVTFNHASGPVNFSAGLHGGYFTRDHFMDVVGGSRAYSNNGTKEEGDAFAKLLYDAGPWHLYGDAQVRWAHFHYTGDVDLGSISWTFFNPKIGARRDLGKGVSVYASLGKATREPSRNDMLAGEDNATIPYDLSAVKPEEVVDFETGVRYAAPGFDLQADLYAMQFTNEIALEGELSAIGLPLRRNVDSSYRRGLEVDLGVQLADPLHLRCTANVSTNEISSWTQFYDVYDPSGNYVKSVSRDYANVEPLLTPPVTLNAALDWKPASDALLGLAARYVSASHLDNTGNSDFTTPSYFDLDASAIIGLEWWIKAGTPRVRVQVNNIFDNRRIWPSGYDYVYFQKDGSGGTSLQGLSYYYPLATRTFFVGLEFHL